MKLAWSQGDGRVTRVRSANVAATTHRRDICAVQVKAVQSENVARPTSLHPALHRHPVARTAAILIALAASAIPTLRAAGSGPKLLVLLVVDQMRGDYVDKFGPQWTAGLHRLMTDGAWFRQVDYPYFDTVTCPGHATIATGTVPSTHGMVLNTWWDRDKNVEVRCTQDDSTTFVSYVRPVESVEAPDKGFYDRWQSSPASDQYMAEMALDVAERMHFDQGAGTDMIAISFSALDRVGHAFGPDSPEVEDLLVHLDRTLGTFFSGLDRLVGPGNYMVALTSDHGVAPIPEREVAEGVEAGRMTPAALRAVVEAALSRALGHGEYVARLVNGDVYLRPGISERLIEDRRRVTAVRDALRGVPGVMDVYTRDQLAANNFDNDLLGRQLARSYDRERSGDLVVVLKPYWIAYAGSTTHGTGYGYDTHVPMFLMGSGIVPGQYLASASPADLAPTFAFLASVTLPRAQGRVLVEALGVTGASHPSSAAPAPAQVSGRR